MDNDMHILTIEFKDKELMKEVKIGARLSSNELTTKLQRLSREAEKKAEFDLLSDSDNDETETARNFIEIEASINLEIKRWKRQITSKIASDDSISFKSSDSEDSDNLSANPSTPSPGLKPSNSKIEDEIISKCDTAVDFFEDMNNSMFFDHHFKTVENCIFTHKKAPKKKIHKTINKKVDKVLDDWHAYAYNRLNDEEAKNPERLQKKNVMAQLPTSQPGGPEVKVVQKARYSKIFNMIQSATYKGANVINQSNKNKYLRRNESGVNQFGRPSAYSTPYNSNLLPFNPGQFSHHSMYPPMGYSNGQYPPQYYPQQNMMRQMGNNSAYPMPPGRHAPYPNPMNQSGYPMSQDYGGAALPQNQLYQNQRRNPMAHSGAHKNRLNPNSQTHHPEGGFMNSKSPSRPSHLQEYDSQQRNFLSQQRGQNNYNQGYFSNGRSNGRLDMEVDNFNPPQLMSQNSINNYSDERYSRQAQQQNYYRNSEQSSYNQIPEHSESLKNRNNKNISKFTSPEVKRTLLSNGTKLHVKVTQPLDENTHKQDVSLPSSEAVEKEDALEQPLTEKELAQKKVEELKLEKKRIKNAEKRRKKRAKKRVLKQAAKEEMEKTIQERNEFLQNMVVETQGKKLLSKIFIGLTNVKYLEENNSLMMPMIMDKIKSITIIKDTLRRTRNMKTIERASKNMNGFEENYQNEEILDKIE